MAKTNIKRKATKFTHEGGPAKSINAEQELRRVTMACLLWEDTFYIDGQSSADIVRSLVSKVDPETVAKLALEIRTEQRLRHVPLLLMRELARLGKLKANDLAAVIQRADELSEFLSLYWADGKCPLSDQVKKGLARAFPKFDHYALGKYNRDTAITLRDVMFMTHPKPKDDKQAKVWKALSNKTLESPDTWEVNLSAGEDKEETFTRLLKENRLGYMALLRNLRNMEQAGVDEDLIFSRLLGNAERSKALPFRFISAARVVPQWEQQIDQAMGLAMSGMDKLPGKTIVLVDVSGSMIWSKISSKSNLDRLDAAAALSVLVAGIAEKFEVWVFSDYVQRVPSRTGMALIDAIRNARCGGTYLGQAIRKVNTIKHDRLIVITDEQSHDKVSDPVAKKAYMINVAAYADGVGYGKWVHIDGFSESVVKFIQALEQG